MLKTVKIEKKLKSNIINKRNNQKRKIIKEIPKESRKVQQRKKFES